jgi:hypothetical protein
VLEDGASVLVGVPTLAADGERMGTITGSDSTMHQGSRTSTQLGKGVSRGIRYSSRLLVRGRHDDDDGDDNVV